MAKNLQENIVPAENQNTDSVFLDEPGDDIRVLFVGNSITKHAPKPQIGWTRDCGMAATCIDNDYVHILKKRILNLRPHASFGIVQVADFERQFENFDIQKNYQRGIDFDADIIIRNKLDEEKKAAADFFGDPYVELNDIVSREETHGEFNHPSDQGMLEIADKFWDAIKAQVADCK